MGNTKERSLTLFQTNLAKSSIRKLVHFASQQEKDKFMHQTNRRMTIKNNHVPKIIYYQSIESSLSVRLHFEDYGKKVQDLSQQITDPFCKCIELLTTIEQLQERYGIFGINQSQIFLRVQGGHRGICMWISDEVQKCQSVKIGSEQQMCHNILVVLSSICRKAKVNWDLERDTKFYHTYLLAQWIRQRHNEKAYDKVLQRQETMYKAATQSIISKDGFNQEEISNFHAQETLQSEPKSNKVIVPKLDYRSIKTYSNRSRLQTQRILMDPKQDQAACFQNKDSLGMLTTARTPRGNYMMRQSTQLTIFPNQYQQKFMQKYVQKCKQQQSLRFATFKKAMLAFKAKTEPPQLLQGFSFMCKGKDSDNK